MTETSFACPVCEALDSTSLYPKYRGKCITSQMFFCEDIQLDNRCCESCGFIFNAKGIRGKEETIYNTTTWKPKPQIISFGKDRKTTHRRALETFMGMADIAQTGSLLDFGAGTGAFLKEFVTEYPGWQVSAIEPGDGHKQLAEIPGLKDAYNAPYYTLEIKDTFDAVVVTSVLEHVADPLGALRWIYDRLKPGGMLIMQHPNFEHLPGDLFCADHINKLTVPHTRALCECAGFEVVAEDVETLTFYFSLIKSDAPTNRLPDCGEQNLKIAKAAEHVAKATVDAVARAVKNAAETNGKAAVFGCTPISFMAHFILDCRQDIACFVDENHHVWGWDIDGIKVVGPQRMQELGITDLAIAISPMYWKAVESSMNDYDVTVHVPTP